MLDTLYLLYTGHLLIVIISGLDFSLAFVFCCFVVVWEAATTARIAGSIVLHAVCIEAAGWIEVELCPSQRLSPGCNYIQINQSASSAQY